MHRAGGDPGRQLTVTPTPSSRSSHADDAHHRCLPAGTPSALRPSSLLSSSRAGFLASAVLLYLLASNVCAGPAGLAGRPQTAEVVPLHDPGPMTDPCRSTTNQLECLVDRLHCAWQLCGYWNYVCASGGTNCTERERIRTTWHSVVDPVCSTYNLTTHECWKNVDCPSHHYTPSGEVPNTQLCIYTIRPPIHESPFARILLRVLLGAGCVLVVVAAIVLYCNRPFRKSWGFGSLTKEEIRLLEPVQDSFSFYTGEETTPPPGLRRAPSSKRAIATSIKDTSHQARRESLGAGIAHGHSRSAYTSPLSTARPDWNAVSSMPPLSLPPMAIPSRHPDLTLQAGDEDESLR